MVSSDQHHHDVLLICLHNAPVEDAEGLRSSLIAALHQGTHAPVVQTLPEPMLSADYSSQAIVCGHAQSEPHHLRVLLCHLGGSSAGWNASAAGGSP